MKKLIGFLFVVALLAGIVFLAYGFINGNIELPSFGGGTETPTYDYYETPENVDVDYSNAKVKLQTTSYTNLEWRDEEKVNYTESKVNLYVSFVVENVEATSIFSFNHDFSVYDPAKSEESTIDLNNVNRLVRLKNGSNSVTITVPNVELNELGKVIYTLGEKQIYVFQYFIQDNSVTEKMSFNLKDYDVKWEIDVVQRENTDIGNDTELTEYNAGRLVSVSHQTQDYSEYDHIGFDGKEYTHTNKMSFKSDYVELYVTYILNPNWKYIDDADAIPTLFLNNIEFTTEDIDVVDETTRKAYYKFKYSDINDENVVITKLTFKNQSGFTSTYEANYELFNRENFVFYDGVYSSIDSILSKEEQEIFMRKYSNQDGSNVFYNDRYSNMEYHNYAYNGYRGYSLTGYMTETNDNYYEHVFEIKNSEPYNTHYTNLYQVSEKSNYMAWINVDIVGGCDTESVAYDPFVIKGNWLVVNNIKVEHLGSIEGSIDNVYNGNGNSYQMNHGKAQINLFNHDVILDGYFNFDGYSIQYGDLESDYGQWYYYYDGIDKNNMKEEYIFYQTFDFAFDVYDTNTMKLQTPNGKIANSNSVFCEEGSIVGAFRKFIDMQYNSSIFSLFQRITENGKFANCYIDYSGIPNNMGQYYNFLGIDVNEGVIDNIKTSGQNFVWHNFGSISNIEQECLYMLNSIYNSDQCDILSFKQNTDNYEKGLLVYYNHDNGTVKNVKTTVNVIDSSIIYIADYNYSNATKQYGPSDVTLNEYNSYFLGANITANNFSNSNEAKKVYEYVFEERFKNLSKYNYVKNMVTATEWKYKNISCVSKFNNEGLVENANITYNYKGSQNLNGYFEAYSYTNAENTAEEAKKSVTPDALLKEYYENVCS